MYVEYVSLFSQFLIVKSFNKHMNVLKDIDNVVQATQKEEVIHALFGVFLVLAVLAWKSLLALWAFCVPLNLIYRTVNNHIVNM